MVRLFLGFLAGAAVLGAAGVATEGFRSAPDRDSIALTDSRPEPTRTPRPPRTPRPLPTPNETATEVANQTLREWAAYRATQTVVASARLVPRSPERGRTCDENYSGACVPTTNYDLDCADIGATVYVEGSDPHGFDADGDRYGCESY
jgi:hypothetical protein